MAAIDFTGIGGGGSGSVTSVGLSMPTAFTVTNSPVTGAGTLTVNANGTASQYIKGDGSLGNFPSSGGGGAGSINYYLNGSVSEGTIGGNPYEQMSKTPILATSVNYSIGAPGYIAQFLTDSGDPGLLNIPAGNWNFELYFSANSSGGTPSFYVELYKYDGSTFTLISSGAASPESITAGTVKDVYITSLAVPATTLLATDRLAVRIFVNTSGRTITLYTQDNNLGQVITTFPSVNLYLQTACSDLYTAISATTNIAYFRAPASFTILAVRASLFTAQTSGSTFTVDIKKNGVSILSTLITIPNLSTTSLNSAIQPVLSNQAVTNDDIITFDVTQAGIGATGLIVTIIGN
jgi:hypothetical protein